MNEQYREAEQTTSFDLINFNFDKWLCCESNEKNKKVWSTWNGDKI